MPAITIYAARIDGQGLSGIVYSFQQIQHIPGPPFRVIPVGDFQVQVPNGYVLENVHNHSPYGDGQPGELMLFDPVTTAQGNTGRVYMRAARVVTRRDLADF